MVRHLKNKLLWSTFCHVLIQDVVTRWDSTLHALRRLLEQRVAIQASLPHVKCRTELSTEEWLLMEQVVSTLNYFKEATKSISKKSACLSDAIPLINSLRKVLKQIKSNQETADDSYSSPEYYNFVEILIAGINDRFDYLESEETFIFSTTLDPRDKLRTFFLQSTSIEAKRILISLITNGDTHVPVERVESQKKLRLSQVSGVLVTV